VRGATRRERFFAGVVFAVAAFLILTVVLRMFQIEGGWLLLPSPKSESALFVFLGLIGLPVFAYIVGKRVAHFVCRSQVRFYRAYSTSIARIAGLPNLGSARAMQDGVGLTHLYFL